MAIKVIGNEQEIKRTDIDELLRYIPQGGQRQDSVRDQLNDLLDIANKLGMYDAADLIRLTFLEKK